MDTRDSIADAHASLEELIDDVQPELWDRLLQLLNTPGERNEGIWNDAGASIDVTPKTLNAVPVVQRMVSSEWRDLNEAMFAAAIEQVRVEKIYFDALAKIDKHAKRAVESAHDATVTELKQAAKEGIPKDTFEKARQARKQRTAVA